MIGDRGEASDIVPPMPAPTRREWQLHQVKHTSEVLNDRNCTRWPTDVARIAKAVHSPARTTGAIILMTPAAMSLRSMRTGSM